ncbi:arylsulfatase [soil metagenome]
MRYLFLLMTFSLSAMCTFATDGAKKPNIVVILVDDMGFSDIGCYGSEIPTPNLDALAANGLKFTQFYNTARCCPTRAALLTGLYSHQTGIGHMVDDNKLPGYRGQLNNQCVTLAEAVKPAGYFTIMCGKWHVGQAHGVTPWGRGFDRSLNAAAGGFYYADNDRAQLFLNGEKIENSDPRLPKDWYTTDLWTDYSIKFVDEAIAAKKPFLLYEAHNAPHFPIQAPEADVAKFRGKYKAGWDKLREQRLKKQIDLGLIRPEWTLSERPDTVKAWDKLTSEEQDRYDNIMAIAAASIHAMDRSVGRLVDHLKAKGELDNTLILFMSDNGGNAESGPQGKLELPKGQKHTVAWTGQSWATLENTPFRLFKHFEHEGGISSPLIAHWPIGIKAKGEWRTQMSHLIDVMPTCVEVAGATYPKEFNAKPILPMEGRSLVGVFEDKPESRTLYWEHENNKAVREGKWKLVSQGMKGWELYDMEADRTETKNLAASMPDRVKAMTAMWTAWAKRVNAIPRPGAKKSNKE